MLMQVYVHDDSMDSFKGDKGDDVKYRVLVGLDGTPERGCKLEHTFKFKFKNRENSDKFPIGTLDNKTVWVSVENITRNKVGTVIMSGRMFGDKPPKFKEGYLVEDEGK